MIKRILIIILFFYILVLIQTSFLAHFMIAGMIPNLILIVLIFLNLFEDPRENTGIISAIIAGFFLDIFSQRFFGFYILILFILSIFLKFILRKHVRIPFAKKS